jgi:NAD(P)H dehydrogenase (quinone)
MATVSIIYFSGMGHTAKLAEAVQKGAASVPGVQTHFIPITGEEIIKGRYQNDAAMAKLDASDAIIFGCPTYMGGPAAQFKAFADASAAKWFVSAWKDKVASGFTSSGSPSGDKLSTLDYQFRLAMQHGMIWVGLGEMTMQPSGMNRLGSFSGAMAQAPAQESPDTVPNAADKMTGEALGKRVAQLALKLKK